jgi:hypothetical protein
VFHLGSSPLIVGKNVPLTSVEGLVPGSTRRAADADRIVFTVDPNLELASPSLHNVPD